jgi:1-deoxy-D-xylulose-5-phosphate synthase
MKYLPEIRGPEDVGAIPEKELPALAGELREAILAAVSENGGHLASNLGAVELTVALHRCFGEPAGRIVFDVGHQTYAHKLLTGRYDRFSTLRRRGGISGFTNRAESPADAMTAGHSGSSLSVAVGMAEAEASAARAENRACLWTVAVIGDGSFTNGMVYEALNSLADSGLKICVVLNDNEMSISKNVGGLSRYLSAIRTSERYFSFKLHAKQIFSKIPLIGGGLVKAARGFRDLVKRTTGAETFFEKLGLDYIGPVNGNDTKKMIRVLEEAKTKTGPVIVHCITKKGLGYPDAENRPDLYHSVGPFDLRKGAEVPVPSGFTAAVSDALIRMAEQDASVTAITAAMKDGCGLAEFAARFPDRFFDAGIAEEHAAAMAGGMALGGLTPVLVLYSTFSQRIFDQLWHDVALQGTHILLCLSHAGLVPGDGVTHQGIYDTALLSRLPGITIRSPSSPEGICAALDKALADNGISVVRYPKGGAGTESTLTAEWLPGENGDWAYADFGSGDAPRRAVIVTYGRITGNVVRAAQAVFGSPSGTDADAADPADGWRGTVCSLDRIVPLPEDEAFRDLCGSGDALLFVEEGIRSGGIGEAFASSVCMSSRHTAPFVSIRAIETGFVPHGSLADIERFTGLDPESLEAWIRKELNGRG